MNAKIETLFSRALIALSQHQRVMLRVGYHSLISCDFLIQEMRAVLSPEALRRVDAYDPANPQEIV